MELNQELISRDYSKLPKKYWASQNLCWYLHDVIMSIFMEVVDNNLIDTEIALSDEEKLDILEGYENVYDWLKSSERHNEFTIIFCKDLFMRLLGDFLNYIHEVLSNLERGKVTIACDLLRKPFKDNLLYMEWILFNDVELSNLVYNEEIDKYAMGRSGLSKEYINEIVKYNVSQNRFINGFGSERFENIIYDIRYNYDSLNSLELVWNKATHLVTTGRKVKTKNFNFIYNDRDDYDEYWNYLYGKIPTLLLHSLGVVENIFDKYFRKIGDASKKYNFSLIMGKFFGADESTQEFAEILTNLGDNKLNLICENCKKIVKYNKPESYVFYNYWETMCPECKKEINTCRYFFLEKYKQTKD
ncbi:hypothetical protein [Paraclostridium bifermentans]|uniref:hypothetical protein n=1 Tax=Paraclostridium bifermentans TaxID=1490 RepID=UPI00290C68E1|nr:hypothetical protein [Paraclostridium bifermentans]MDU3337963.1 hypothetical protein [Paraclostridium bifermentans]